MSHTGLEPWIVQSKRFNEQIRKMQCVKVHSSLHTLQRHTGSVHTVKFKLNLGTLMETSDQLYTPAALYLGKSLVPNKKESRQALGPMLATLLKEHISCCPRYQTVNPWLPNL